MRLSTVINKTKKKNTMIDVREAFNLWDILKSKYDTNEKMEMYKQYAHDS
ncbi:hypothetical protein [Natronospora cellulosivora (SeqCode)]